ncbi:MAG: hypothetical protein NC252_08840 [Roseburia sp.]|nr:hypothetical protein [Roseburia sp.]MCM1419884.1 hypothetical protein [Bacteroides sp.]
MEDKKTATTAMYKTIRRDLQYLKLSYLGLQRRFLCLMKSYDKMVAHHLEGVEIYEPDDGCLQSIPHISISEYARKSGISGKQLMKCLTDDGILIRDRNSIYLCDPARHGHLVFYKKVRGIRYRRYCLYWNKAGVGFLNEYAARHGLSPKKEIIL